jgi:choline-sulfatase
MRACTFVLVSSLMLGGTGPARQTKPSGKWNVITILTDDQALWAMGVYGNREIQTPAMDRLARQGARFTHAFSASGVCTPSRVAILTGLYPTQVGMTDVPGRRDPDDGLPRGVPTWSRALQKHGYRVGLIGKWHLGRTPDHFPTNYGIDYFFGFLRGVNRPVDPILTRDGAPKVFPGPTPDILTDDAIRFIEENRSRPFALMLHYRAPHAPHLPVPDVDLAPLKELDPTVPVVPADRDLDDDQEPASPEAIALHVKLLKEKMRAYYASVHSVDRNLDRLLARLDELDLSRKTIVLFTSDQGYMFGHRGLKGKGAAQPIRNHTLADDVFVINLYDHSVRVPLLIRWPGVVNPGTVIEQLTSHIDIYPSILGMLEIKESLDPRQQGKDFSVLLHGGKPDWRDAVFAEYTSDQVGQAGFVRMVRTRNWKLVRTHLNPAGNQLFDLAKDPEEMTNLYYLNFRRISPIEDFGQTSHRPHPFAEVLQDLQARLTKWQEAIGDPAPHLDADYEKARETTRKGWSAAR